MTLQVLQWPTHQTFGILSHLFISDYIYDSWTLDLSGLCVEEHHKRHTHKQRRAVCTSTSCLIRDQYFICSSPLPRCWLASLPKGTAQGHAHMCSYALSHSQHTHTLLLRAGVCFDWRIGRAVLTPLWHSISFRWTSLFTNYSEQNATCVIVCVSLCMCVCVLNARGLLSIHTSLVSLLHHCLHI